MRAFTAAAVVCVVLLAAAPAMADQVLGIKDGAYYPAGGIYWIDTVTGAATLIAPTHPSLKGTEFGPNGLAVGDHGILYYTSYGQAGGDSLFSYSLYTGITTQFSTPLAGIVASGSFYDGKYYYIPQGSSDLHEVKFNLDGTITDTPIMSADPAWKFGDIAISAKGMLYGSSKNASIDVFSIDLADFDGTFTIIATGLGDKYQLAFSGDTLYGLATDTGKLYRIDVGDGSVDDTGLGTVYGWTINDMAGTDRIPADAIPEPAVLCLLVLGLSVVLFRARARKRRSHLGTVS